MTFSELGLIEPILRALETEGYTTPTPIQAQTIPVTIQGRDVLGCAQTGTGKTAAFAIPILQREFEAKQKAGKADNTIKALILTPTRELALQIGESFAAYGRHTGLRHTVIFGGVGQKPQEDALRKGIDILVATPGRLLDLMQQGYVTLKHLNCFVLDEADRMLDMGFIHDVKKVIAQLPKERQTLFFSATMPPEIAGLADAILTDPVKVAVTPVSSTAEKIEQSVYFVEKNNKRLLLEHLLQDSNIRSALVFTRTKHGADRVTRDLHRAGIKAAAIHGNKAQNARVAALNGFKTGKIRVLVATDIAARGIDVEELSHVINFELPNIPETYVHRIGRTGRAGNSGIAISFCMEEEVPYLADIQKLTGIRVPVVEDHPWPMPTPVIPVKGQPQPKNKPQQQPKQPQQPQKQKQNARPQQQPPVQNGQQPKPQPQPNQPHQKQNGQQHPQHTAKPSGQQQQNLNTPKQPRQPEQPGQPNNQARNQQPGQQQQGRNQEGGANHPGKQKGQYPQRPGQHPPVAKDRDRKGGKPDNGKGQPRKKSNSPAHTISRPDNKWSFLNKKIEIKWDEEE